MGDGDDAARHREVLAAPDGQRLDAALDLVEAGRQHAGGLVGFHSDESGDGRYPRHPFLGEQPYHLPSGGPVALYRDLFSDRHLALSVGDDGENLLHFEVDLMGAVGVEQFWGNVAGAQPLHDQLHRHAETRRDGGDGLASLGERRDCENLISGVHGDADDILGER